MQINAVGAGAASDFEIDVVFVSNGLKNRACIFRAVYHFIVDVKEQVTTVPISFRALFSICATGTTFLVNPEVCGSMLPKDVAPRPRTSSRITISTRKGLAGFMLLTIASPPHGPKHVMKTIISRWTPAASKSQPEQFMEKQFSLL